MFSKFVPLTSSSWKDEKKKPKNYRKKHIEDSTSAFQKLLPKDKI